MQSKTEQTLEDVKGQFEAWRRIKSKRERIPEQLWQAAVSLSSHYSPSQIVKELKLDFTHFKARIGKNGVQLQTEGSEPRFVQVPSSLICSFVEKPALECSSSICIERADGATMRLVAGAKQSFDVETLFSLFLGGHHDCGNGTK